MDYILNFSIYKICVQNGKLDLHDVRQIYTVELFCHDALSVDSATVTRFFICNSQQHQAVNSKR